MHLGIWNNKAQGLTEVVCCGFGDAGAGTALAQDKSEVWKVALEPNKISLRPYYLAPRHLDAMAKNPFGARRYYRLNEDSLASFYKQVFWQKKRGKIVCAAGGGSWVPAICSIRPILNLVPYLDFRIFISEKPFFDLSEDGERAYLSLTFGFPLLRRELTPEVCLELVTIPKELHGNYLTLDKVLLDIDTVLALTTVIRCGLDPQDWLQDPAFKIRTFSLSEVLVLSDPGFVREKVVAEVSRLRPLFQPELIRRTSLKVLGSPVIVMCGPEALLREVEEFLSQGQGFSRVISLEERDRLDAGEDNLPFRKLVVLPLDSPKVWIVGVHPINSKWWQEVVSDRERIFQELLEKVKNPSSDSSRVEVLRRMIRASGYSAQEIEALLKEGL